MPGPAGSGPVRDVVHPARAAGRRKPSRLVDLHALADPDHAVRRVRRFPGTPGAYPAG